jgi:methanogenic corrinoid protein MtbC1
MGALGRWLLWEVKMMIGRPPTTGDYARKIGADFRGNDAYEGVEQVRQIVSL